MNIENQRSKFESWAQKVKGLNIDVFENGEYKDTRTFFAWQGWQNGIIEFIRDRMNMRAE